MNSEKQSTNLQMILREVNRVGEVKKNIPKLRFKGYEDAWEQRKLGTIITVHPSKDLIVEAVEDEGRSIVVQQGDSPILGYSNAEGFEGYINVTIFGDHTVSLYKPQFPFVIATDGVKILSSSILQHQYFYTVLEKYKPIPQGYKRHFSILKEQIANITVNKDEQKKIGEFFETIGDLITLHQRKYDALKTMKKTLLSKIFPKDGEDIPEIRFKGFTDAWEQRKLGDIADIVGGGTPSTAVSEYWDGDIDWYAPAEIVDQIFVNSSQKKITTEGLNNSSAKMLPVGTVLFTSRAGIGKTAILTKEGCTNQGFQSIIPNKDELDSYFIFSRTDELKRYGETVGAGSTFVEVSGKQMANMTISIPTTMGEQRQIGTHFRNLDNLITLHQRRSSRIIGLSAA